MKRGSAILAMMAAVALPAAGLQADRWTWTRIGWPSDIQQRLLGSVPLERADLVGVDLSFSWGQGVGIWTYSPARLTPAERTRLCPPGLERDRASFQKQIEENVELFIDCRDGQVRLVEEWS